MGIRNFRLRQRLETLKHKVKSISKNYIKKNEKEIKNKETKLNFDSLNNNTIKNKISKLDKSINNSEKGNKYYNARQYRTIRKKLKKIALEIFLENVERKLKEKLIELIELNKKLNENLNELNELKKSPDADEMEKLQKSSVVNKIDEQINELGKSVSSIINKDDIEILLNTKNKNLNKNKIIKPPELPELLELLDRYYDQTTKKLSEKIIDLYYTIKTSITYKNSKFVKFHMK